MRKINKVLLIGDAMIPSTTFVDSYQKYMKDIVEAYSAENWESNWDELQRRRLEVEKYGPQIESIPEVIMKEGKEAEMLLGLFVPISAELMNYMPNLRIIGVCRAGLENVNLEEATKRGILVFNVEGRNAEAVSDFTIGLMLAESRNIARAHNSIKHGKWQKEFSNSTHTPQMKGKTIGIFGFGYIGRLVAQKLKGFDVRILVFDPYVEQENFTEVGVERVSKEKLFTESDFVTVHARLSEENTHIIGKKELSQMKKTSYFINTARAGLIDHDALIEVLQTGRIAGAGLDVFPTEPLSTDDKFLSLDNVTLTTHIAGTTEEALNNSPALLMEDIRKFLSGEKQNFIVNRAVLQNSDFRNWFQKFSNS